MSLFRTRPVRIALLLTLIIGSSPAPYASAQSSRGGTWSQVARAVMPAVVNISTARTVRARPMLSDPFFRFFFDAPEDAPGLGPRRERGVGSGVIVSADGLVLTNNHVIERASEIRVALGDRREFRARLIGTDPRTDLAVLRLPATGLPAVALGDSDRVEVADSVLAVGNPFGLGQTVTMGIVSAIGRANLGIADYEDFIQTDTAINPGNSGGALVNARGELIGINTAIFSRSGGYQGIGFAVPINMARAVMDHILKHGRVVRGSIGVAVQDVTPALARGLGLPDLRGVLVSDLAPGGPAAHAGLRRGDVVLKVGDRTVDSDGQFRNLVAQLAPGSRARVLARRGEREQAFDIGVIERAEQAPRQPPTDPEARTDPLGMTIADITPEIARQFRLSRTVRGVLVTDVLRGGLADEAGLRPGDLLVEVNRTAVTQAREVARLFQEARGKDVVLLVNRGGSTAFVVIDRGV
jgi:serine protease Do